MGVHQRQTLDTTSAQPAEQPVHGDAADGDFEVDQILYCSLLREPMTDAAIEALAQSAARLNRLDRITGVLMHSDGVFVQFIEGPPPAVRHLWERLLRDKRHYGIVQLLHRREVEQRTCGHWDMRHVQFEVLRDLIHSAKEDISKGKANAWAGAIERMDFLLSQDNWRSFVKDLQSSA